MNTWEQGQSFKEIAPRTILRLSLKSSETQIRDAGIIGLIDEKCSDIALDIASAAVSADLVMLRAMPSVTYDVRKAFYEKYYVG